MYVHICHFIHFGYQRPVVINSKISNRTKYYRVSGKRLQRDGTAGTLEPNPRHLLEIAAKSGEPERDATTHSADLLQG